MLICEWLPAIVEFGQFSGNWELYLDHIYTIFEKDFLKSKPEFNGTVLNVKRHPKTNGKKTTFWHLISAGEVEVDRTPDLRRCERVGWPRPIIENSEYQSMKIWRNERRGETRILLWLEEAEYLVVLTQRKDYLLFWTAYPVTQNHSKRKLQKEYEQYQDKYR